jgi:hypothetical protein
LSLEIKWIFPDVPADNGVHFGIHLEWVKETSMYRIFGSVGFLPLERVYLELRKEPMTSPT